MNQLTCSTCPGDSCPLGAAETALHSLRRMKIEAEIRELNGMMALDATECLFLPEDSQAMVRLLNQLRRVLFRDDPGEISSVCLWIADAKRKAA